MTYTIGCEGGNPLTNLAGTIPYSWLVGVDGKVLWQGNGTPPGKMMDEELKKVTVTADQKAAKATKALEYAEGLIASKQLTRALAQLDKVSKTFKGSDFAKKADDRKKAIEADESLKAELTAQKALEKITDGAEMPKEKFKGKERDSKAVQLEAFIKKNKETAPAAAEQAGLWVKVMQEDWAKTAK
jgi:hypothetical protein